MPDMAMQTDSSEVAALAKAIASLSAEIASMRALAQTGGFGDGSEAIDLIAVRVDDVLKRVTRIEARHEKLVTTAKDSDAEVKRIVFQRDAVKVQLVESNSARTAAALAHAKQLDRTRLGVTAAGVLMCVATLGAARWWYQPPVEATAAIVHIERTPTTTPASSVLVRPNEITPVTAPIRSVPSAGDSATPQMGGDYACAFGYRPAPGLNCPPDVRGVTGQHRSTKTVR
jgi:hypothetical protein